MVADTQFDISRCSAEGLLAAARYIRETERPNWAAIAYDLGYASQQHFNVDFKKALGRTPAQYKKSVGGA